MYGASPPPSCGSALSEKSRSSEHAGVSVAICLLVVMLTPVVTVLGYEKLGYRHVQDALSRMRVG